MEANYFTILWWFLPYIHMNQPWVYMCSPSWPSLPPPSPSHPSGSSQCTIPEHPASCIEPGLAIYFTYDNIHISTLFSQILPHLPSPTESKSLFVTSVQRENLKNTPAYLWEDFTGGPVVKNLPTNAGNTDSVPGPGRFHVLQGN